MVIMNEIFEFFRKQQKEIKIAIDLLEQNGYSVTLIKQQNDKPIKKSIKQTKKKKKATT